MLLAAQVGSMLGKVVAEADRVSLFIELLVDVFWKILTKNAACPSVKPVVNPGMYMVPPATCHVQSWVVTAKISLSGLFVL